MKVERKAGHFVSLHVKHLLEKHLENRTAHLVY